MSLQVEKLEKNMAKLTVTVDADVFEKACEKAYNNNKSKMSVPGFRKGKVPRQMIEKMYGAEVFFEEAADIVIRETYGKELDENKEIEVVSRPEIEVTQIAKGQEMIYTATVALKPSVELSEYKGVKIEKINVEVSDEDVNAEIEKERERNARTISVDSRAVQDKDTVVLDFDGSIDGVPFEGGKGDNYPLVIGSGSFIPGFEEQLIGANLEEEKEVKVTFPVDYQAENLAGKEAVFKCVIHEIKEKELPELDDEFAAEVSEFDTLAEYKESVKKALTEAREKDAKNQKEQAAIEEVVKGAKMDIPDAMVDTEAEQMVNDYAMRLKMQGLSIEQYFMFTGLDKDKFKEEMKEGALKRIQQTLVLEAVAKAEGIEATDEDVEEELKKMAEMYNMKLEDIKNSVSAYEKEQLQKDVAMQKAAAVITDSAVEK